MSGRSVQRIEEPRPADPHQLQPAAGGSSASGGASAPLPVMDHRDLDTAVRLRTGDTLVLAGTIRARESEDDRGVPWLRRIRRLGQLFAKREKQKAHTELAIFLTPILVEEPAQLGPSATLPNNSCGDPAWNSTLSRARRRTPGIRSRAPAP